jgi:hypothetical protein
MIEITTSSSTRVNPRRAPRSRCEFVRRLERRAEPARHGPLPREAWPWRRVEGQGVVMEDTIHRMGVQRGEFLDRGPGSLPKNPNYWNDGHGQSGPMRNTNLLRSYLQTIVSVLTPRTTVNRQRAAPSAKWHGSGGMQGAGAACLGCRRIPWTGPPRTRLHLLPWGAKPRCVGPRVDVSLQRGPAPADARSRPTIALAILDQHDVCFGGGHE